MNDSRWIVAAGLGDATTAKCVQEGLVLLCAAADGLLTPLVLALVGGGCRSCMHRLTMSGRSVPLSSAVSGGQTSVTS